LNIPRHPTVPVLGMNIMQHVVIDKHDNSGSLPYVT